jgi:hypothetical protein
MNPVRRSNIAAQVFSCWNWKCALLSASTRSMVYAAALAHPAHGQRTTVALVEMTYITLTAGFFSGMQQRSLSLRSRALGNFMVAVGVPGLSQMLDWAVHRMAGGAPARATVAMFLFTFISALFHLHVMRNGVFLTGHGRSLADDFRRIPRLLAGFVAKPFALAASLGARPAAPLSSDVAA